MSNKWADYVITCVTDTADGGRISTVGVRVHNGSSLGSRSIWHRDQVVRKIDEDKKTFVTATKTGGTWKKGAMVRTYASGGETFIRTDTNKTAKDNLGKLPKCEDK